MHLLPSLRSWLTPRCLDSDVRVGTALLNFMKTLSPIPSNFIARPMIPLIEAVALKIVAVANVDRDVHEPTYRALIAAC